MSRDGPPDRSPFSQPHVTAAGDAGFLVHAAPQLDAEVDQRDLEHGEQGHHRQLDDVGLAQDHRPDVLEQAVEERRQRGRVPIGGLGHVRCVHA